MRIQELVLELQGAAARELRLLRCLAGRERVAWSTANGRATAQYEVLVLRMLMHGRLTAITGRHHRAHLLLLPEERAVGVPLQQVPSCTARNLMQHVA